jgi:negative regulator of genetic competence, sporulation and motility
MELIRISDRKLKIMLTPTDMRHFEFNIDTFGEDSAQMHHSFRLLLDEIKQKIGFEADDNRLSVQYFPSREGGCEMFISHLPLHTDGEDEEEHISCVKLRGRLPPAKRGTFHRECAYRFPSLSALLAVCGRLCSIGYIGASSAHRDESGCYYLLVSIFSATPFSTPEELSFIIEYGQIENTNLLKLYLREHGTTVCAENAVHQLGQLK